MKAFGIFMGLLIVAFGMLVLQSVFFPHAFTVVLGWLAACATWLGRYLLFTLTGLVFVGLGLRLIFTAIDGY